MVVVNWDVRLAWSWMNEFNEEANLSTSLVGSLLGGGTYGMI